MNTIAAWLLVAITAWGAAPIPAAEAAHTAEVRRAIAEDFVAVAYATDEPPIYAGSTGRAVTALNLVSIAALESRFLERILLGHCHPGECDGGKAVGMMQVHPGPYGLHLSSDGKAAQCRATSLYCIDAQEIVADWTLQIRAGLHILRTQGWSAFSPSAAAREQAAEWLAKHPPPLNDAEVTP
jgi:hypothetical protein